MYRLLAFFCDQIPGSVGSPLRSLENAGPHQGFDSDGMFRRMIVEVRYDPAKVMQVRGKVASKAVVVSSEAVAITGIIIQVISPPYGVEECCANWDPSLEVIPRPFAHRRRRCKRRRPKSRELRAKVVKSHSHHWHDARRDRRSLSALRADSWTS